MSGAFANWKPYAYNPSAEAAIAFASLFSAASLLHTYALLRTRTWFLIPLVLGGFFEAVGYVGRTLSARETPDWTLTPYIMQSTLLLVSPALFAASIYMILGRIILLVHGEKHSVIRLNWLTKIFVAGDVLSFVMQSSGAAIMVKGNGENSRKLGEHVIVGGLFVQIIFFGLFIYSAAIFHLRYRRCETMDEPAVPWKKHMWTLYVTSMLILVRSVFRAVEYIQGHDGVLLKKEVWLYFFDAALMWQVLVAFLLVHPSEVNVLLGRGEKMARKAGLGVSELKSRV